jgi:hypothetical protein
MRDPLQTEKSPYEVLGVSRGAQKGQIESAFMMAIKKGVPQNVAKNARDMLVLHSERRLWHDLMEYDEKILAEVEPELLKDERRLSGAGRWGIAQALEQQLKGRFPHLGLVHSLGVLWYWWTLSEEQCFVQLVKEAGGNNELKREALDKHYLLKQVNRVRKISCDPRKADSCREAACSYRESCKRPAPELKEMWQRVSAYWGMLLSYPEFWGRNMGLGTAQAEVLKKELNSTVQNTLHECARRYEECLGSNGSQSAREMLKEQYAGLVVAFSTELECAKALRAAGIRANNQPLSCGALMLAAMGLLETVRKQVQQTLSKQPNNPPLVRLGRMLSPYGTISLLLDQNKPERALAAIARMQEPEQTTSEVQALKVLGLHLVARQKVSVKNYAEAIQSWGLALRLPGPSSLKEEIQAELVMAIHARAVELQNSNLDNAIELLESAYALVSNEKLKATLAEFLKRRGIIRINRINNRSEAQLSAHDSQLLDSGVEDLKRASSLGSKDATEQLQAAMNLVNNLRMDKKVRKLLEKTATDSNAGNWDSAILSLEEAEKALGAQTPLYLKERLGNCYLNRGIKKINDAQEKATKETGITQTVLNNMESGLKDLEKSQKIGNKNAAQNIVNAKNLIEITRPQVLPDDLALLAMQAVTASAAKEWSKAIVLLDKVIATRGRKTSQEIKKKLAHCLANRGIERINQGIQELNYDMSPHLFLE